MDFLIISSCLSDTSKSYHLSEEALSYLHSLGYSGQHICMQNYPLPLCGTKESFTSPMVGELKEIINSASAIILSTPIYNYDCNAVAKNMIELTGSAWSNKVVGFLCMAGGEKSYMSILSLANSLMLDFRCLIAPQFVYVTSNAFRDHVLEQSFVQAFDSLLVQRRCSHALQACQL